MLSLKKYFILLFLLIPICTFASEPIILINEICWMGTNNSSNDEWIELYNNSDQDIDLNGWILKANDDSPTINLEGTIKAEDYFLLERTDDNSVLNIMADQIYTGSLGNTGEYLKLFDSDDNLIDEINNSDDWIGGDNTTKQTLERKNLTIWQTSLETGGTPKALNSKQDNNQDQEREDESTKDKVAIKNSTTDESTSKATKKDIVINEVFPNPAGVDLEKEFIEIKNISNKTIDLTGWILKNLAGQTYTLPSLKMTPESIAVFYRSQTKIAFNNNKEKIKIYSRPNLIIDQIDYQQAPEEESFQRNNEGKYFWQKISPRKENKFTKQILPVGVINGLKEVEAGELVDYDASDSFDPQGRALKFFWDFGDGRADTGIATRQIYTKSGEYNLTLKLVVDEFSSSTETLKIKVIKEEKAQSDQATTTLDIIDSVNEIKEEIPFIFISEFLPNPQGSDENEFIEIFSNHYEPINLIGWQLDDQDGGSKPYIIPDLIIKPGEYKVFMRTETKIALNNNSDEVRLFSPSGILVDLTEYEESKEGQSFVLDEQFIWQQSNTPTPGEINTLDEVETEEEEEKENKPKILGATTEKIIVDNSQQDKTKYFVAGGLVILIFGINLFFKIKNS